MIVLSGCAYAGYLKDPFVDIPAFSKVTDNLYRGAYPKPEGYTRLKSLGIKTIVNLSDDTRYEPQEKKVAAEYGFNYVHIPLGVYTWPEDENVLKFLQTVLGPQYQPVFVHCSNGRDRTGAMIAVYRTIVEGKGPKEGYKEALDHGFWPYRGEVVLKKYIHQLKDRKILYEYVESHQNSRGSSF
ncbi:MAG: tyrosine-protein phosphatase [Candidatus Omnitrophica bacterium]|nr:tyrosine-protein phosphatase [Candidatus Omnitrophota bacterium]